MLAALMIAAALTGQAGPGSTGCSPTPETRTVRETHNSVSCFVHWLYGPGTLETLTPLGDDRARVFTPSLVTLIERARADENSTAFDADPICQCQDPGSLRLLFVGVLAAETDRAVAHVAFDFAGTATTMAVEEEATHVILTLDRPEGGEWRINDIVPLQAGSFRRSLRGN